MSEIEPTVIYAKKKVRRPMTVDYASQRSEYYRVGFCRRNIVVKCECRFSVKKYSMEDHVKTTKHLYTTHLKMQKYRNLRFLVRTSLSSRAELSVNKGGHGNVCGVCSLPSLSLEIDHIIPLAGGGTNNIENLQPLCNNCHKQKTSAEKELGAYTIRDIESSIFNKVALENVITRSDYKAWQFVEKLEPTRQLKTAYKIDMRKCRRNLTYNSKYEFPVYSVMDNARPFSGAVVCGTFYVKTKNIFPMRGSGWYSQPLVEYALGKNIIQLSHIKMEFIPSNKLPAGHFKKPIDTLLNAFEADDAETEHK